MKHFFKFVPLVCVLLCLVGCGKEQAVEKQIFAMNTYMSLTAYGDNAEAGLTEVIHAINAASKDLDPEVEGSAVYTINHSDGTPTEITPMIHSMLDTAALVWNRTGALDLTIYPVVKAWGFVDQNYRLPAEAELEALKSAACFADVILTDNTVTLPAGAQLSFGAMAKGAVAEESAAILKARGVESAFLNLGGNVQTVGLKPDGSSWRVGITAPENTTSYVGILSIGEKAVVTSGGYQRYFEQDGKVYHHILDPKTAAPAETDLTSVTIICDSGTMADALSTTMFILGEQAALAYRAEFGGFDMVLVTADGRVVVAGCPGFEEVDGYTYEYVE